MTAKLKWVINKNIFISAKKCIQPFPPFIIASLLFDVGRSSLALQSKTFLLQTFDLKEIINECDPNSMFKLSTTTEGLVITISLPQQINWIYLYQSTISPLVGLDLISGSSEVPELGDRAVQYTI